MDGVHCHIIAIQGFPYFMLFELLVVTAVQDKKLVHYRGDYTAFKKMHLQKKATSDKEFKKQQDWDRMDRAMHRGTTADLNLINNV